MGTRDAPDGFLMDYSLHRVARYLRLLGYNAVCDARIRHGQLMRLAESENLALVSSSPTLTAQVTAHNKAVRVMRESGLSPKRVVAAYDSDGESIYSDDECEEREVVFYRIPEKIQKNFFMTMVDIIRRFGLSYDAGRAFSRCVSCNDKLAQVSKESVQNDVPEAVYETYDFFTRCPKCRKVFWGVDGSNVYNYTSFRTIELLQRLCREAHASETLSPSIFSLSSFQSFPMTIRALVFSFLQEAELKVLESVFPSMKNLPKHKTGKLKKTKDN